MPRHQNKAGAGDEEADAASNTTPTSTPLLDSLIDPDTLAKRLGVKRRTVDEWRINGKGPVFIRVGRTVRYSPEAVDAWLRSQQYTSTSEER